MSKQLGIVVVGLLLAFLSCARPEAVWRPDGIQIRTIDFQYIGPRTVEERVLRRYLHIKPGMVYSEKIVEADFQSLFESGYIEELRIITEPAGGQVRVIIEVKTMTPIGATRFDPIVQ